MKKNNLLVIAIILVFILSIGGLAYYYMNKDEAESKKINNDKKSVSSKSTEDDEYNKTIEEANKIIEAEEKKEERYKEIKIGQDIVCDNILQFTLEGNQWTDVVLPSDTSGVYSYFKDEEGKSYYLIKGKIKNLYRNSINISQGIYCSAKFNDNYNYPVVSKVEDIDTTGFENYIDPLEERNWYLYISVPDEVKNNFKNVTIKIAFKNDVSYASSDDYCTNFYKIFL